MNAEIAGEKLSQADRSLQCAATLLIAMGEDFAGCSSLLEQTAELLQGLRTGWSDYRETKTFLPVVRTLLGRTETAQKLLDSAAEFHWKAGSAGGLRTGTYGPGGTPERVSGGSALRLEG